MIVCEVYVFLFTNDAHLTANKCGGCLEWSDHLETREYEKNENFSKNTGLFGGLFWLLGVSDRLCRCYLGRYLGGYLLRQNLRRQC